MNILAGAATMDQFYDAGLARCAADLYDISKYQLLALEGWQDRSAQRFLDSLDESRTVPFERVLFALGIRYVGETTAKAVARHFGSIDAIAAATEEQLLEVGDVGDVIAASIYRFMHTPAHADEIERLRAHGLQLVCGEGESALSDALAGKVIVISGNFSVSRDAMKELIARHGGKCASGVTGKTSFLLAGSKPGPEKLNKCAKLGIPVIGEEAFMALLPEAEARLLDKAAGAAEEGQLSLF